MWVSLKQKHQKCDIQLLGKLQDCLGGKNSTTISNFTLFMFASWSCCFCKPQFVFWDMKLFQFSSFFLGFLFTLSESWSVNLISQFNFFLTVRCWNRWHPCSPSEQCSWKTVSAWHQFLLIYFLFLLILASLGLKICAKIESLTLIAMDLNSSSSLSVTGTSDVQVITRAGRWLTFGYQSDTDTCQYRQYQYQYAYFVTVVDVTWTWKSVFHCPKWPFVSFSF